MRSILLHWKRFCIRGGEEQHSLGPSQFIRSVNPDCFMYVQHGSKHNGRAKDLKFQNIEVPCPAVPESGHKCLFFLLDFFIFSSFRKLHLKSTFL